jgi:hypothetical protein
MGRIPVPRTFDRNVVGPGIRQVAVLRVAKCCRLNSRQHIEQSRSENLAVGHLKAAPSPAGFFRWVGSSVARVFSSWLAQSSSVSRACVCQSSGLACLHENTIPARTNRVRSIVCRPPQRRSGQDRRVAAPPHHHCDAGGEHDELGQVSFPTSCAAKVRRQIEHGVALLHSFGYTEAGARFQAVARMDPTCAMAHWGVAIQGDLGTAGPAGAHFGRCTDGYGTCPVDPAGQILRAGASLHRCACDLFPRDRYAATAARQRTKPR